ncbi:MAG: hypothetical protein MUD16_02720 [Desulfobacterales bacterium]|jgi:hypothetical protein|nr:hypothetical protein [Desulfobacterales bacterium]
MELFYGSAMICAAAVLFGELMVATRKPAQPAWMGGFILTSIYVIVVISLPMLGIALITNALASLPTPGVDLLPAALSLLVLAASLLRIAQARRQIRRSKRAAAAKVEPHGEKKGGLPADSYHGQQAA